ncbi:MAG TPA: FAD/NAD(P)-binding oxidoreductase [Acidimicrobiales bacterium]|nr:FAD/NAD(P)-binding oxidoreductase [Acidimicrobiales bacterium]
MARRVLVLGGGTGGTLAANRLRRVLGPRDEITVVDADDRHLYQPGLLFVPFGLASPSRLVRSRAAQLRPGVTFVESAVDRVDLDADTVVLADGTTMSYDVLVVASGSRLLPDETEGLTGAGWGRRVHTFYTLGGAAVLGGALATFEGGRIVVNLVDLPVKCPVAPLEFCFLADWYLRRRGIRARTQLTLVTPLDGAFTKPGCNRMLSGLLGDKGVEVVTEFATAAVDGEQGRLVSYDERTVPFDTAVMVPVHGGAAYVGRSPGLGDPMGFVPTDPGTLQARAKPNVFVIGDATDLRASKAGSVAHFEGEVLVHNVRRLLAGQEPDARFDGHTNCFIETGFGRALLIDFNDALDPVPGRFPGPVGLPLLKESRLNHLGKLAFEQLYWHAILPGRDIPFIESAMPAAGKRCDTTERTPELVGGPR